MKIIFYSTHCSHCRAVEMMLKKKNIQYEEIYIDPENPEEVQIMLDLGLQSAPGLVVDDQVMNYNQALNWIRGQ